MLHRRLVIFSIAALYYGVATVAILAFETQILMSSIVLFGLPAYVLARFSLAPFSVLLVVGLVGTGIGIMLETIAHLYGLWYTAGTNVAKLFGVIPLEGVLSIVLQVVFLALIYETLFDDGVYTERSVNRRIGYFVGITTALLGLSWLGIVLKDSFFIESAYIWLLLLLMATCFVVLFVYRAFSVQLLDRIILFSTVAVVPLMSAVIVAVFNVQKVFALGSEYSYTFSVLGETIPLEEVVLVALLPLLVATVYELYLDDQQ